MKNSLRLTVALLLVVLTTACNAHSRSVMAPSSVAEPTVLLYAATLQHPLMVLNGKPSYELRLGLQRTDTAITGTWNVVGYPFGQSRVEGTYDPSPRPDGEGTIDLLLEGADFQFRVTAVVLAGWKGLRGTVDDMDFSPQPVWSEEVEFMRF